MLTTALIESLKFGLSLWNTKESNKYIDQVIKLERALNNELKKDKPYHNIIDNINDELCIITKSIQNFRKKDS